MPSVMMPAFHKLLGHVRGTAHEAGRLRALTHRIVWLVRYYW